MKVYDWQINIERMCACFANYVFGIWHSLIRQIHIWDLANTCLAECKYNRGVYGWAVFGGKVSYPSEGFPIFPYLWIGISVFGER